MMTLEWGATDVQIGNLDVWRLVIRLDGTLQLQPRSSSSDGSSNQAVSAQSEPVSADATAESSALAAFQHAPQIGCLAGTGLSLKDGGQVWPGLPSHGDLENLCVHCKPLIPLSARRVWYSVCNGSTFDDCEDGQA